MATNLITPEMICSFPELFEPKSYEGSEPKYSMVIIISKEETSFIKEMDKEIKSAGERKWGLSYDDVKKKEAFRFPIIDGDTKEEQIYKNSFILRAKSIYKPQAVDKYRKILTNSSELYAGCRVRASISFYGYTFGKMSVGIACGLNAVFKIQDGDPLGSFVPAEQEFKDYFVDDSVDGRGSEQAPEWSSESSGRRGMEPIIDKTGHAHSEKDVDENDQLPSENNINRFFESL